MKNSKLFIALTLIIFSYHAQSTGLLVSGIASTVGPMLMPIVKEESKAITLAIISGVKKLSDKSTRCKVLCNGVGPLTPCKTPTGVSACKAMCQEIMQVGGYEIKLRFWDKGSITNCLKAAVKAGLQTSDGKGNTKSISVYSQEDLNLLIELISYINAAEKVIISKGGKLDIKVTTKEIDDELKRGVYDQKLSRQEITQLIKNAKSINALNNAIEVKSHAEAQIIELIKSGRFGNQ
ncbi:MAG: hypothetical protein ACRYGR_07825 [Janthinobacterium lividum]